MCLFVLVQVPCSFSNGSVSSESIKTRPFLPPVKGTPDESFSNRKWRRGGELSRNFSWAPSSTHDQYFPLHLAGSSTKPLRVHVTIFMRRVATKLRLWRKTQPLPRLACLPPLAKQLHYSPFSGPPTTSISVFLAAIIMSQLSFLSSTPHHPHPLPKCRFQLW